MWQLRGGGDCGVQCLCRLKNNISGPVFVGEKMNEGEEGRGGGESQQRTNHHHLVSGSGQTYIHPPPVTQQITNLGRG